MELVEVCCRLGEVVSAATAAVGAMPGEVSGEGELVGVHHEKHDAMNAPLVATAPGR